MQANTLCTTRVAYSKDGYNSHHIVSQLMLVAYMICYTAIGTWPAVCCKTNLTLQCTHN